MSRAIIEGLWQVAGGDLTGPSDAAAYLVRFGDNAALVDAGSGEAHGRVADNIRACLNPGATLDYILLTHCHFDHSGGAAAMRNEFGSPIVAHELDAVYLESGDSNVTAASWYGAKMEPTTVDVKLDGQERVLRVGTGDITAIHWPGHSPGSVVFTTQLDGRRILFGQDVHGPLHPALLSDRHLYQNSLAMLLKMEADLLLEGHFGIFEGRAAIRNFIRSFMI